MALKGNLKIDVPVYPDDDRDLEPVMYGIYVLPQDLEQDPNNPSVYRMSRDYPEISITVTVQPNGSTLIQTIPGYDIFENTLHI